VIDIMTKINLNGVRQRIHVVTNDETKPVLLFLHGGPGVCNRHTILTDHIDLLDTFTLATWDQRGTGGSYYGVKRETLTAAQVTKDAADLVLWLCERFQKKKVFVIGGSWGSQLMTMLARDYPERIAATVGFGQVVDGELNEKISYEFRPQRSARSGRSEVGRQTHGSRGARNGRIPRRLQRVDGATARHDEVRRLLAER